MRKLADFLSKSKTVNLVFAPAAAGIVIILAALSLIGTGSLGDQVGNCLLPIGLLVAGFMGMPIIVRKQIPGLAKVPNWMAFAEGLLLILIPWAIAFALTGRLVSGR